MIDIATRISGAMQLSAMGDALGWITEFIPDESKLFRQYDRTAIRDFIPWIKTVGGRFYGYKDHIFSGSYSDDTQLMLAVARCTEPGKSSDVLRFAKQELPAWLMYARGGGRTVKIAAAKIQRKHASWSDNFFTFKADGEVLDYRDCGANGAAMRILPIALVGVGDWPRIRKDVFSNSIATHGHARGLLGALLYASAVNRIMQCQPDGFNPEGYLVDLGKNLRADCELPFLGEALFAPWVAKWSADSKLPFEQHYNLIVDETLELLRVVLRCLKQSDTTRSVLQALGCIEDKTRGSGTHTMAAAIYLACRHHAEPSTAIEEAVNAFGSDTDSIAAFAGGILGALHGENAIPERWCGIQDRSYIQMLAKRIAGHDHTEKAPRKNFPLNTETGLDLVSDYPDKIIQGMRCWLSPLGSGTITTVDRQRTLTKGRYNLILDVAFDIGQTCRIAKLFTDS